MIMKVLKILILPLLVFLAGCISLEVDSGKLEVDVEPPRGWYTIYFEGGDDDVTMANVDWPVAVTDDNGIEIHVYPEVGMLFSGPYALTNASVYEVSVNLLESDEDLTAEWFCNPLGGGDQAEADERAGTCVISVDTQIAPPSGDDCPCTQY